MLISYAQNFEDVILNRVFKGKKEGFYIDIGACFPDSASVTKCFYDMGWFGINVEPHPQAFFKLSNSRLRDINLNLAIAEQECELVFYEGDSIGETSAIKKADEQKSFTVTAITLGALCAEYVKTEIDFLKIDVEGYEYQVLTGGDWQRYRPKVIVCEVTEPWSNKKRPDAIRIEKFLANHSYHFVYFDGLNDYYVAKECSEISTLFALPPNVLDNFISSREFQACSDFENLHVQSSKEKAHLLGALNECENQLRSSLTTIENQSCEIKELKQRIQDLYFKEKIALERIDCLDKELNDLYRLYSLKLLHFMVKMVRLVRHAKFFIKTMFYLIVERTTRLVRFLGGRLFRLVPRNNFTRRVYRKIPFLKSFVYRMINKENAKDKLDLTVQVINIDQGKNWEKENTDDLRSVLMEEVLKWPRRERFDR